MAIQYETCKKTVDPIFENEIESAIHWLIRIQDKDKYGWGWIQHIPPNEQNTAEVVCALLSHHSRLTNELRFNLYNAVEQYLINPEKCAVIAIDWVWVLRGLQLFEDYLGDFIDFTPYDISKKINLSRQACRNWLINNQNHDGGWADIKGDPSSVTRTSLAIISLLEERPYDASLINIIERAMLWLIKMQNSDGGWGNVKQDDTSYLYRIDKDSEYETNEIPYDNIECQYLSNAACTGYAILALNSVNFHRYRTKIKKAIHYLIKEQHENGGWTVFCEVGRREGVTFTFRHFSTVWALKAMLETNLCNFHHEYVLDGINYLLTLQDQIYGGWKSSPDSDSYTWSTCNALELLGNVQTQLREIKASNFLYIVKEWWDLKTVKNIHTWNLFKTPFSFNTQTWLLFSVTYTLLLLTWDILIISKTPDIFVIFADNLVLLKIIKVIEGFLIAILIGVPWVVLLKNTFKKEMTWLSSISWIYGIISGVLIAFYAYIIN